MDGVGEYVWIIAEYAVCAIALCSGGIDNHDADAGLLLLKIAHSDGDIIKDGEGFATSFKSMVSAAG